MAKRFEAAQFTPTEYDTAADKAKFANQFVRFVEADFRETLFPKWFYKRLSMTFGNIAHYNQAGFYAAQFSSLRRRENFLRQCWLFTSRGSPAFTYSDVERVLADWISKSGLIEKIQAEIANLIEANERQTLAVLKAKYEKGLMMANNEQSMIKAHRLGRQHAAEHFAAICLEAMHQTSDADAQFSYIAGVLGELKRIASTEIEQWK